MEQRPAQPIYMALADRLGRELEAGGLPEGARVISVRKLAGREGVSIPTAVSALRQLETRGRIVARPRSGWHVAPKPVPLPSSQPVPARPAAVSIRSLAREVFTLRDKPTVRLGAGIPQGDWLPRSDLDQALRLAAHRLGTEAHSYSNTPGSPELRDRLARHLTSKGVTVSASDIVVTAGATEALELALAAIARPGDVVAVESPCYFGYLMCLERLGLRAMELRTHPVSGLDIDAALNSLDQNKVAAVIVSPSVHNPTGASIPVRERRRLVAELTSRGIPLVEDDTYGDLAGSALAPCKAFDDTGKVVYCGSASKTISPGWRLGWIVPGRWRDEVVSHRLERSLAGSLLYETALAEFLTGGRYERHLQRMRDRIDRSRSAIVARVASSFPKGTRMAGNNAGYTLWLELPATVDAVRLMRMAATQGIGVAPGPVFSASLGYRNYVRLNVANDPTPRLLAAVDRLGHLAAQML